MLRLIIQKMEIQTENDLHTSDDDEGGGGENMPAYK